MKIKILIVCLFLGNTLWATGQRQVNGRIINLRNQNPVSYASVVLLKENTGTNADGNGNFSIYSNDFADSIRISSIGFSTKTIAIADLKLNNEIKLDENEKLLNNVVIESKRKEKTITLNDFSNCGMTFFDVSKGTYNQVAQYFNTPDSNMFLSQINICKMAGDCIFHIRIYGIDSLNGKPSKDLTDSVIEVNSSKRNINIDMEKYDIRIPGKGFFVAVEWLFIPYNAFTTKSKLNGKKYVFKSYYPSISFRSKNIPQTDTNTPWILNFNGRWSVANEIDRKKVFLISPTLRY